MLNQLTVLLNLRQTEEFLYQLLGVFENLNRTFNSKLSINRL